MNKWFSVTIACMLKQNAVRLFVYFLSLFSITIIVWIDMIQCIEAFHTYIHRCRRAVISRNTDNFVICFKVLSCVWECMCCVWVCVCANIVCRMKHFHFAVVMALDHRAKINDSVRWERKNILEGNCPIHVTRSRLVQQNKKNEAFEYNKAKYNAQQNFANISANFIWMKRGGQQTQWCWC